MRETEAAPPSLRTFLTGSLLWPPAVPLRPGPAPREGPQLEQRRDCPGRSHRPAAGAKRAEQRSGGLGRAGQLSGNGGGSLQKLRGCQKQRHPGTIWDLRGGSPAGQVSTPAVVSDRLPVRALLGRGVEQEPETGGGGLSPLSGWVSSSLAFLPGPCSRRSGIPRLPGNLHGQLGILRPPPWNPPTPTPSAPLPTRARGPHPAVLDMATGWRPGPRAVPAGTLSCTQASAIPTTQKRARSIVLQS